MDVACKNNGKGDETQIPAPKENEQKTGVVGKASSPNVQMAKDFNLIREIISVANGKTFCYWYFVRARAAPALAFLAFSFLFLPLLLQGFINVTESKGIHEIEFLLFNAQ